MTDHWLQSNANGLLLNLNLKGVYFVLYIFPNPLSIFSIDYKYSIAIYKSMLLTKWCSLRKSVHLSWRSKTKKRCSSTMRMRNPLFLCEKSNVTQCLLFPHLKRGFLRHPLSQLDFLFSSVEKVPIIEKPYKTVTKNATFKKNQLLLGF